MSERSKAILASYRGTQSLPDRTRRRALAGLHARIAAGVAPRPEIDVTPPDPVSQGFVAQWLSGPLAKVGIAIVALTIPAALLLSRGPRDHVASGEKAEPAHATVPVTPNPSAATDPPSVRTSANVQAREQPPAASPAAPEPVVPRDALKPATKPADSAPRIVLEEEEESSATTDTIDEEVALLSRAHAALRAGHPTVALARVNEHARRFPNSKLGESREATRILALCAVGQKTRARTEAERFLAAHPGSAFTTRLRNVCAK